MQNCQHELRDYSHSKNARVWHLGNAIAEFLGHDNRFGEAIEPKQILGEHKLAEKGIHQEYPLGTIDNGDMEQYPQFNKFLEFKTGRRFPNFWNVVDLVRSKEAYLPSSCERFDVESDNYARHGIAMPIEGTDYYICLGTFEAGTRFERFLKKAQERLKKAFDPMYLSEIPQLQVVIRKTLVEN